MATLHFNLVQKRILDLKQAAVYVGLKTAKRLDFDLSSPSYRFGRRRYRI